VIEVGSRNGLDSCFLLTSVGMKERGRAFARVSCCQLQKAQIEAGRNFILASVTTCCSTVQVCGRVAQSD
jgi:hypothetical protein